MFLKNNKYGSKTKRGKNKIDMEMMNYIKNLNRHIFFF